MINDKNYVFGDQDVQVPAHLNFGKFVLSQIRRYGRETALVDANSGKELSYKDLTQYAVDLAYALHNLGVRKGDVVVFCSEKRIDFIGTLLAIILTGATFTPVEFRCGIATLKHKLDLTKPKYIICSKLFWDKFKSTIASTESIKTIIGLDDVPDFDLTVKNIVTKSVDVNLFEPIEVKGQSDVAFILFSSGTTGPSKGILLTHENCILSSKTDEYTDEALKTIWTYGLWYHNYSIFMTFKFLLLGRKHVFVSEWDYLDYLLQNLHDYKVNIAFLNVAGVTHLSKSDFDEKLNFDSLKIVYSRSAPLRASLINAVKNKYPSIKEIHQGYGMTEAGEPTTERWATKGSKPGSVGMVSPGTTIKVVDVKTDEVLGPNQQGEIRIRGPVVMKGYISVKPNSYIDEDGFFKTGDIGYYDEDHYFYIIDRIKDIILYGGYKISPTELESIILLHPGVREVAVVGKPDPLYTELPAAFVVKQPHSNITEEELINFVADQAEVHFHLRGGVRFIEEMPRNDRQKILRTRLREIISE